MDHKTKITWQKSLWFRFMLHIAVGGHVILSGGKLCGGEFVVVANWRDTHQ